MIRVKQRACPPIALVLNDFSPKVRCHKELELLGYTTLCVLTLLSSHFGAMLLTPAGTHKTILNLT